MPTTNARFGSGWSAVPTRPLIAMVGASAKDVRPIPKYSLRGTMAQLASGGENDAFNRNIANRLWALAMGRGLVEPPDDVRVSNPPSHPELHRELGKRLISYGYDDDVSYGYTAGLNLESSE